MADTDILLQEDSGSTRILTLNRPRRLNALNGALVEAICDAVARAHERWRGRLYPAARQ